MNIDEQISKMKNQVEAQPQDRESEDKLENESERIKTLETNMTISTKLSTDRLICKTPHQSLTGSIKSVTSKKKCNPDQIILFLGTFQFILGFLMMIFGIFVIAHKASLSQLGGGIWGGLLAMATGIAGVLASAKNVCPLKDTAQKVARTVFLALSLISLAVAQLIVVIAGTGLARDIRSDYREPLNNFQISHAMPTADWATNAHLLFNVCLIAASSLECICAILSAYKSSRELCPCFKKEEEYYQDNINMHRSHAIVSSWLGKHSRTHSPQPIYVVTGPPSSLSRGSKLSGGLPMPMYAYPAPMVQPQIVSYPMIPAPLGPVPSPIVTSLPNRKMIRVHKRYKSVSKSKSRSRERSKEPTSRRSRSKSLSAERQMPEQEVVMTYTGLDRAMAEKFIDICETKNTSLCSDTSCSTCQSPCDCSTGCNSNSDANSQDGLVNKT
ncbi:uncharacterized protein LOC132700203 isoform X2 [Cylas formicarius]|uniref:uncharacterized protein LOC132700203 isoform X2 n=1 Tax=Cylas formicarius TaxID=197179 RepID=UPI0029588EB6|nr:uncharacterized protein LOC132700203 isoform X2 [Cylas formicarius]